MKKLFALFLCLLVPIISLSLFLRLTNGNVEAKIQMVEVGGTLTADEVWTAVNSPYILSSTIHIPVGITLTVEPGVTVLGQSYGGIVVEGKIIAIGTPTEPITFTSVTDSAPGEWPGFFFWDGEGHFEHVAIRYGGEQVMESENGLPRSGANINVHAPQSPGFNDSDLNFRDVQIQGSEGFAMFFPTNLLNRIELDNVTFSENITDRIQLLTTFSITMDASLSAQPGLDGYEFDGGLVMFDEGTLTLEPGVTLFCGPDSGVIMQNGGHLTAVGTPEKPITFTTITDTAVGHWGGIFFWDGSAELAHAHIRFAGADVGQQAVSALHIYEVPDGQEAILDNIVIEGSGGYGIAVEVDNLHQMRLHNGRFINNALNQILLLPDIDGGDGSLAGSVSLPGQEGLTGYEIMPPGLIVPTGLTLTVGAGATVRSETGVHLRVAGGHLEALGTQDAPVEFTSVADGSSGEWGGLQLVGGTAVFNHTEIRFAVDNLAVTNTAVSIQNSQIHSASNNGIHIFSSGTPALTIANSDIFNNGGAGLLNENAIELDARNIWWGHRSGPAGNGQGSGDAVLGNVLFAPWLEEWVGDPPVALFLPLVINQ